MARDTFENQLNELKNAVLVLGRDAGQTVTDGVEALKTRDRVLADSIIAHDEDINQKRYRIEERCYALMATQQPLASDLREIISILLITIELERIADHAKNLAEIVIHMGNEPLLKPLIDIPRMAETCRTMLEQALDAFSRNDARLGRAVCDRDDEIDFLYQQVFRELMTYVLDDPRTVQRALNLLFAAHNLERVGDRITNIGERVIYAATGRLEELNVEHPIQAR
ncbi:MAG: phosphate signaling complex protein PhoU [Chloroflexi bacterium]|nr:phosphate signaling complex protein PhoU [Chloroflexota bacterium]